MKTKKFKDEKKSIKFDIKAHDEDDKFMIFKGIGSPYNGKADLGNDIVEDGAFSTTLKQKGDTRVLLFHHDTTEPIGTVKLEETKQGLMITEGKINKNIQRGREVAELISMGALKGLSIGYRAVKVAFDGDSRILKEIALFEMSIVPFPMDEDAEITSAKSDEELSFEDALSMAVDKLPEAKESDLTLINETIRKLNGFLMKSFDESIKSTIDDSLSDQDLNVDDDHSDNLDSLSEDESKDNDDELTNEELKELLQFSKELK
jgi:HK97 family phage prohead protease